MWSETLTSDIQEMFDELVVFDFHDKSLTVRLPELPSPGRKAAKEASRKRNFVPAPKAVAACHPERRHYAKGQCKSCYTMAKRKKAA